AGLSSSHDTLSCVRRTLDLTHSPYTTLFRSDASTAAIDHFSKVYGTANPGFGVRYSGFVNGDSAASLGGSLTFSTAATASSPVEIGRAHACTPATAKYSISFAACTLNLPKAA